MLNKQFFPSVDFFSYIKTRSLHIFSYRRTNIRLRMKENEYIY